MTIRKNESGFLVDVRPDGRDGKRYRKKFETKAEALKYEKYILSQHHNKDWLDKPKDIRRISELIPLWFKHHGSQLKTGTLDLKRINSVNLLMGDPRICDINNKFISEFAANRLEKIKKSTYNRDITVLSSLFTQLQKSEIIYTKNPFKGKKLKILQPSLSFLTMEEIELLLSELAGDCLLIAKICLSTGSRWSEAQLLKVTNVHNQKITFNDTKNGKPRTVPITKSLFSELQKHKNTNRLFEDCYSQFMSLLKEMDITLPKGQATHVMRHTFASHYMMNGGNLLALQKILGHSDIQMTMRYAHLAPDYLIEVLDKNPLNHLLNRPHKDHKDD